MCFVLYFIGEGIGNCEVFLLGKCRLIKIYLYEDVIIVLIKIWWVDVVLD